MPLNCNFLVTWCACIVSNLSSQLNKVFYFYYTKYYIKTSVNTIYKEVIVELFCPFQLTVVPYSVILPSSFRFHRDNTRILHVVVVYLYVLYH